MTWAHDLPELPKYYRWKTEIDQPTVEMMQGPRTEFWIKNGELIVSPLDYDVGGTTIPLQIIRALLEVAGREK